MLSILGLVVIFVATYYVYKTAKDYDRNALLWAAGTFCVGFGLQIVLPLVIAIVLGIVLVARGMTDPAEMQKRIEGPAQFIGIFGIILSFVGMWAILKLVSRGELKVSANNGPSGPLGLR